MATAFDNRESKGKGIILIIIIVVIVLILAFVFGGASGLWGIIKFFLMGVLIIGFFGFIFYVVWYLFLKSHPRNIPHENWKGYLRSALDNGSDMMEELVLTGDKNHSAKRFMTIKGYLRVLGFDGQEYDYFIGKKSGMNFLEEYKIVMLKPNQHSDLVGDVYIYGISLIMKYGYYFLNTNMLDFNAIDKTVANDTYRTLMYETLGDMKQIVDRSIGLDESYRKEQMNSKILKIPIMSGQQNSPPNQGNQ
jgi:energy-coupling factor transporter transmembrane protein EcfT